jgi:hypothetical protein
MVRQPMARIADATYLIDPEAISHSDGATDQHPRLTILDPIEKLSFFPRAVRRNLHLRTFRSIVHTYRRISR